MNDDTTQRAYQRVLSARLKLETYLTLHGGRGAEAVAPVTSALDDLDLALDELEFSPA